MTDLTFTDALRIARGCFDFGGGYAFDSDRGIFHHGIQTVVNALTEAQQTGLSTLQGREVVASVTHMEHVASLIREDKPRFRLNETFTLEITGVSTTIVGNWARQMGDGWPAWLLKQILRELAEKAPSEPVAARSPVDGQGDSNRGEEATDTL